MSIHSQETLMSLSANTNRRSPVPPIVLAVLSGVVAYRLRPVGGVLVFSGAA
jgi:hypothetical protein